MRRRSAIGAAAALIAACVFGAALLISLMTGAGVYRQVRNRVERAASSRVGLSYVTAKLHAYDAAGAVSVGTFGDGDALFLAETADGAVYETIVYVYDGFLMELSRPADADLKPAAGQRITEAKELSVQAEGGLLRLRYADGAGFQETADVFLKSGQ